MFSRWYARWNFNGVLMTGARVCEARAARRKRGRRRGNGRKNGAGEEIPMTVRTCRRHQVTSAFTPRSTLSFLPPRTIFYRAPGRTCRCSLNFTCQPPVGSLVSPRSSTREISSCGVLTLVIRSLASRILTHRKIIRHRTRDSREALRCCRFCRAKNMKAR